MSGDSVMDRTHSLRESFRLYRDRRLLIIFVFGIASGFPWVLIGSAMIAWLTEAGLTRTAIGFFGSIFAVYTFNFAWAPLVDRVRLPLLGRMGQRRSWITLCLLAILGFMIAIAFTDPGANLKWTSLVALGIAIASATQDIAIDAYRIDVIGRDEQVKIPHGSAMATSGWWTGYSLPGAVAFFLADREGWTWGDVYLALTGVVVLLLICVFIVPEPKTERDELIEKSEAGYRKAFFNDAASTWSRFSATLAATVVEPFREFFARHGVRLAVSILAFIFLFKVGEAFLGRMSIVFYKEVGFTNTEIGTYSKLVGWWVTIIFAVIGSVLNARFGIVRGLFVGGIAMASTNLLFSLIAAVGPDTRLFAVAVIVDNFTSSFATVTFVAFISYLTSRAYTATQYALMASLGNLGRTLLAGFSGVMVDGLGGNWEIFFVITALMVAPSLLLLAWLARALRPLMPKATG
jgi:PAT family beta-lactamase induction signal transducer AmpG